VGIVVSFLYIGTESDRKSSTGIHQDAKERTQNRHSQRQQPPKEPMPLQAPPVKSVARDPNAANHSPVKLKQTPTSENSRKVEIPHDPPKIAAPPIHEDLPRVAIIIDDIGNDLAMAEKFIRLGFPLTLSLFPNSRFGKRIMDMAREHGTEIMLHLPMEPEEYAKIDPGEGVLLTSMSREELANRINLLLDAFPGVKGVNNHMGSRLTAEESPMEQLFEILKRRGLFFIDSRTSMKTVAPEVAQRLGLPFAERDVFLDNQQDPQFVKEQIEKLIQTAQLEGKAVGIAHPYDVTHRVLRQMLPLLHKQIRFVPAFQLVRPVS